MTVFLDNCPATGGKKPETRKPAKQPFASLRVSAFKPTSKATRAAPYCAKAHRGRFLMRMLDTRNRDWLNRRISNS